MKPPLHRKVILVQKKLFFIRKSYALKSSKKYFLPDDSGLYKNFFIGENDECRRETAPPQAALRSKVLKREEGGVMEVSKFAEEELRRAEAIKRDKTLQAMIRTRDMQIQRLRRKLWQWRCLGMAFITLTGILLMLSEV